MKKNRLFLGMLAASLTFGLALMGCPPASDPPAAPPPTPFTFKYDGTLELPQNTWGDPVSGNNQAQVTGTKTGIISAGKTYNIKITGTLSHAVVLKVVFIDNEDGKWHVLSDYGTILDLENEDGDGNPLPKILPAGALKTGDDDGIVIQVTTTAGASDSVADANKVVLIGENTTDADTTDKSTEDLKITNATIQVAEVGKPYPEITPWEAPLGAKKYEVDWKNNTAQKQLDIQFPYTTAIPANAEYPFTIYLPKGAALAEGQLQIKGGINTGNTSSDWDGAWVDIGALEAYGIAHVGTFTTEGEYEVFHGVLTEVEGSGETTFTAKTSDAISYPQAINLIVFPGDGSSTNVWGTYSGNIAFEIGEVRVRQ
jgi:hypothetical protein